VAGSRHGMCELAFNVAGERHGMCESAFRVQIYSGCPSALIQSGKPVLQTLPDTAFRELLHGKPLMFVYGLFNDVLSIRALGNVER
jgi:hypothetical protein